MNNRRYVIQEKLGAGGMGAVYKTKDRLTGEMVALKRVQIMAEKSVEDSDIDFLTALALEFRTLAGLRHPHIIRVIDYGFIFEDNIQHPYFTMEYLPSATTLTKAAIDQPLEIQVRLLTEMLMALDYLHRRGVIHRDLKPDNVLVDSNGRVKVLDFGLALGAAGKSSTNLTDGMAGTIAYMAPELFTEETATVRSDLYAVGMLIYEVFTGKYPFNQKNLMLLINDIMNKTPDVYELDNPLDILLERLLSKDPLTRQASAEELIRDLCTAMNQPQPPESTAVRESFLQASRFVGRNAEMEQLKIALDTLFSSSEGQQADLYLFGGESGVGKSRLLDEGRTRALVRGALVLRGQGMAEGGLPFQLWRDITRELILSTDLSDLEASILKEIVPDIGNLLNREVADVPELTGGAAGQRLVLTLVDLLKRQTQPLVLLLEDLQWAEESLAPVKQILMIRDQLPRLLVIGTYRDDERPDLPEIFPDAHSVKLLRLDDAAIALLTESMLGEAGTQPEVLDLLKRETEGNAFFMVETVRALAEEAGMLSKIGRQTLPAQIFAGGVGQIIRRRLSRVPDFARPLLQEAAVAGRWLDLKILGQGTSSIPSEDIDPFLTACADVGVLEIVEGRWRFNHDKLRETLLQDLSDAERRDLHRRLATTIERVYPNDESYHETLLEHWRSAGDTARELHYLVPLVRHLVDIRSDFDRGVLLAEHGLTLVEEADPQRPALLNLLGKVRWRTSDFSLAIQWVEQAWQVAKQINDLKSMADSLYIRGMVLGEKGEFALATDYHQQSLVLNRELAYQPGIADSLLGLGVMAYFQGNYPLANDYFQQSLVINREIGSLKGIANNLGNLGLVAQSLRDFTAAKSYTEQSLAILRSIGNRQNVALGLTNLGQGEYKQGNLATAIDYYQQSLVISREFGDRSLVVMNLSGLGNVELVQSNLSAASDWFQQALALSHTIDSTVDTLEALVGLARLRVRTKADVFAAELAGLIDQHPALDEDLRAGELAKLKQDLEAVLSADELAAALERGKTLNMDTIVQKLLAENPS